MHSLIQDLRYAARTLRKSPGFAVVAILTLALGIGVNTAVFTVVDAALLEPLPFDEPDELMVLWEREIGTGRPPEETSAPTFEDWQAQSRAFEELAAWRYYGYALTGVGDPVDVSAIRASANLFRLLGVEPALGRTFRPEEEEMGRHRVVVLSQGLWQSRFGADPGVVGRSITLDSEPYTVVGVMPAGFRFPDDEDIDVWTPLVYYPFELAGRFQRMFNVIGRLGPDVTIEQARAEMSAIADRLAERFPDAQRGWDVVVQSAKEVAIGDTRPALLVLLGAVAFVLLIACANVASLFLARAADRRRELAIRTVLGGGRWELVRPLLTESALIALIGGAAGLLIAFWGVDLIVALDPEHLPHWNEIRIDGNVLAFTALTALITALLAGLVPALNASRVDLNAAISDADGRTTAGTRNRRLRHAMIVSEVALSIMLLVGAGLLIRSFAQVSRVDPGFDADQVLAATIYLPEARYPEDQQQHRFFERLLERVGALPGVLSVGAVTSLPLSPAGIDRDMPFRVPGTPSATAEQVPRADFRMATEGYFRAMGIPLIRGRALAETDRADTPCVMVVNETFVRRFLPEGMDPLGTPPVVVGGAPGDGSCAIVGIVGDVRHRGLDAVARPEIYVAFRQWFSYSTLTLAIRTAGDPIALAPAVKGAVFELDPALPLTDLTPMTELLSESVAERRFRLLLLGGFAALALLLAASGIYGVISYTVAQQTRAIGIRMALGARGADVRWLVVRDGLLLVGIGTAIGLAAAFALTRLLSGLLYGISAIDPVTFIVMPALLGLVALAATYIPAHRATRVDPMVSLRTD